MMKIRIRKLLEATPFRPFVIRMTDGVSYKVEHPEFVLASTSKVPEVLFEEPNGNIAFLAVPQIASLEIEAVAAKKH
jgi:hypothetical protein